MISSDQTQSMTYFASESDPHTLVSRLEDRVRLYQRSLRSNIMWRRIIRNLRMVHGLNYPMATDSINFETKLLDSGRLGVHTGLFRTYLSNIHTIATGDRIAFRARAKNTDSRSLIKAQLGNAVLDDLVNAKRNIRFLKTAAWHALLLNVGFVRSTWDPAQGDKLVEQDELPDGTIRPPIFQGGMVTDNPTIADVAWDMGRRAWDESTWCIVRSPVIKYDFAAQFPDFEDEILKSTRDRFNDIWFYYNLIPAVFQDDIVYRYDLYHMATPALPAGRHVVYIPGTLILDEQLPYDVIPVFRCCHGEFFLTGMGYSVANDLQSPQEMEQNVISSLATNLAANAVGHIWQRPGNRLTAKLFEGGPKILVSAEEPKPVNFTAIPPDAWKAVDVFQALMEKVSGVNATRLGQPEANIRSGRAQQLQIAQAWQAASAFASSYKDMAEDWATHCLRMMSRFAKGRMEVLIGKANLQYMEYTAEDLQGIDRVVVEAVDPNANTYVGRVAEATDLMANQVITTPDQYAQVKATGSVDTLYEAPRAKMNLIREENENLRAGIPVHANELQDHKTHIQEHSILPSTVKDTEDLQLLQRVIAHDMEHIALWTSTDPNLQMIQLAMGNMLPPTPPAAMPPGMPPPGVPGQPLPPGPGGPPPMNMEGIPMPPPPPGGGPGPLPPAVTGHLNKPPQPPPIGKEG